MKFAKTDINTGIFGSFGGKFKNGAGIGIGTGYFKPVSYGSGNMPVFFELCYIETKNKVNAYVSGKIGTTAYVGKADVPTDHKSGAFLDLSLGAMFKLCNTNGIFVHASCLQYNSNIAFENKGDNDPRRYTNFGYALGVGVKL
ncbi:hypothetical protein [Pinibacter aurantiacus]|uniref:Outer membrane protein beta-barrel domain-containing protein n=1 Tax=Pinibacter aurantiacus TaxID=2851599 RepID=A0A9E2W395_9BACT|nr:hypothetical protein [Pinibacter aurantiacus]MBV4358275.1 hypothetical protein [Pinibacter aurantiacus]